MTIEIKPGTKVLFSGGTGRGNADQVAAGSVNGDPILFFSDGRAGAHVPVYVRATDQIVYVALNNIVGAETA